MAVAGVALAAASCTDFSDYNKEVPADNIAADNTLWQNISANSELSNFAQVLKRVGYDQKLDASRTYTVWAPKNGTFDMDSLSNVTDDRVISEFVENHVADFSHKETDANDTVVYMLNGKLHGFTNKGTANMSFDNIPMERNAAAGVYNYPSTNGMLYVLNGQSPFRANGYEFITDLKGTADSLYNYVKDYEVRTLDLNKSVKGQIIDGVQHYDDSVIVVSNSLIANRLRAKLESEDSTYTVLIPSDEVWKNTYDKIKSLYKYKNKFNYQSLEASDVATVAGGTNGRNPRVLAATKGSTAYTLTSPYGDPASYWADSIAKLYLTNYLFYSNNVKYNKKLANNEVGNDSIYSTTRSFQTNVQDIYDATERTVQLSNGTARILKEYPFRPYRSYAPNIQVGYPDRLYPTTYKTSRLNTNYKDYRIILNDYRFYLTNVSYYKTNVTQGSTQPPELDYYIPNVLSTSYDVYMVVVDNTAEGGEFLPYSLRVDMNYTKADGTQVAGRFNGETLVTGSSQVSRVKAFVTEEDTEKHDPVHVIKLGTVDFDMCYAGLSSNSASVAPNIKVMHTVDLFNNSYKYDKELRISRIILIPHTESNTTNEE